MSLSAGLCGQSRVAQELCALLIESGVVDTSSDRGLRPKPAREAADSESAMEALRARLDRLDPREKNVLQHAAVVATCSGTKW